MRISTAEDGGSKENEENEGPAMKVNPLVPKVQKIKIRNLTLNRLLNVEFVKKMVHLGAHYSERQGLMG